MDHIYNHMFKKYLDHRWIQQSIVWTSRSRRFKRTRDKLTHINYSYKFLPTTYKSIEDVDLLWEDFVNFYIFIYYIITLLEHVINTFPNLLHFLDSRDVYKKEKGIPLVGQEHTPPSSWNLGLKR
jgi:hypothetical protein